MRALLVTAALSLASLEAHAAGIQCGADLVIEGDSQIELLQKCGVPAHKEQRTAIIPTTVFAPGTFQPYPVVMQVVREEWTYNFGPHRFMQTVYLENGVVTEVRPGPYGSERPIP